MKVKHAQFGTGSIKEQDNDTITIQFDNGDLKKFAKKYVKLQFGSDEGVITETAVQAEQPLFARKERKSKSLKKHERAEREKAAWDALPNIQKIKQSILWINGKIQGDRNSTGYQLISERLAAIWLVANEKGNTFIKDVIDSVERYMRASEKQAYVIARFADENGLQFKSPQDDIENELNDDSE